MDNKRLEQLFLTVQKPGRYSGGEMGSVIKNKDEVDVRFAFCFPDTYEIGMSHLGMKIFGVSAFLHLGWILRRLCAERIFLFLLLKAVTG